MSVNVAHVRHISLRDRTLSTKGELLPITNMFDYFSDETDDPREAISVVAGPDSHGKWIASNVTEDDRAAFNELVN